jgi:hypothetical protein
MIGPAEKENGKKSPIIAVAAARSSLFAGPVRVVFRFAMHAWKKTRGG